ncbi:MAG: DUF2063 domain-containing protein, partial [Myxococcales bacterium]
MGVPRGRGARGGLLVAARPQQHPRVEPQPRPRPRPLPAGRRLLPRAPGPPGRPHPRARRAADRHPRSPGLRRRLVALRRGLAPRRALPDAARARRAHPARPRPAGRAGARPPGARVSTRPGPGWLGEFQARFGTVLRTPLDRATGTLRAAVTAYDADLCRETQDAWWGPASGCLAVYNRQYWFRLFTVLQQALPLTTALVGPWAFNELAADFLLAHPPASWDIDLVPDGFAAHLPALLDARPRRRWAGRGARGARAGPGARPRRSAPPRAGARGRGRA